MTFRTLLAALIAVVLVAGHPVAPVQAGAPDCATIVGAADDACCGAGEMAACSFACSATPAAVATTHAHAVPLHTGSPLDHASAQARSVSRPPETAPPKLPSA